MMNYQDKNLNYTDARAYDKRIESSVLENYVLGLWQPFLKRTIRNLSIGKIVVDLGCGTCEYTQACEAASKIYAVDISEPMLKVCREKMHDLNQTEIFNTPIQDFNLPEGRATDLVITIGVWEYIDPNELLGVIKKITHRGSKVIVVFPNIYNNLHCARSIFKLKMVALRSGFIRGLFRDDFILLDSESRGMVTWVPCFLHPLFLPIWRFNECLWRPFQKYFPLGVNIYYLFERK